MNATQRRDLMRTPYRIGGRVLGKALDCWGTVLQILAWRGVPCWDPWDQIRSAWRNGALDLDRVSGFPPEHWHRVTDGSVRDGDVWLFFGSHAWSAIVHDGHVWTSDRGMGFPYCRPVSGYRKPVEAWRYDPSARPQGCHR